MLDPPITQDPLPALDPVLALAVPNEVELTQLEAPCCGSLEEEEEEGGNELDIPPIL